MPVCVLINSVLNVKALVGAFNQEKALVGAFSVIVQPGVEPMEHYTALVTFLVITEWMEARPSRTMNSHLELGKRREM